MKDLIKYTLYEKADLNSLIPDVDQMAEYLHKELDLTHIPLPTFTHEFLEHLASRDILRECLYPNIIQDILGLIESLREIGKELCIASWTQGNVFLQSRKAEIFQGRIAAEHLANPHTYAALDKLSILPHAHRDLLARGCDEVCVLDDRLPNIMAAEKALGDSAQYIHKIRPDKTITHRLGGMQGNMREAVSWGDVGDIMCGYAGSKIGLLLDKDGVIYNTTLYRRLLEESLEPFLKSKVSAVV